MNHPNSSWKDEETFNIKKDMVRYLDRDIRFKDLGDAEDHRKCFVWEYIRTRLSKNHKFKGEHIDEMFPFYIKSFPEKPYKSHALKIRSSWLEMTGTTGERWDEDLFLPYLGTTEEIDLGFYKGKLPTYKAELTFYLNPNWPKKKLLELVDEQSESIYSMLEIEKNKMEKKGYVFPKKDDRRPKSYWRKKLKALGHYRLLECVDLSERFTLKTFGIDAYVEEKVYRREIRNFLPDLPCSWIRT